MLEIRVLKLVSHFLKVGYFIGYFTDVPPREIWPITVQPNAQKIDNGRLLFLAQYALVSINCLLFY